MLVVSAVILKIFSLLGRMETFSTRNSNLYQNMKINFLIFHFSTESFGLKSFIGD